MRINNHGLKNVFSAWLAGKAKKDGNVSTDGTTLYSYQLPILTRTGRGVVALDRCESWTRTTTKHINATGMLLHYESIKATPVSNRDMSEAIEKEVLINRILAVVEE